MPLNEQKIVSIILEESTKILDRCGGYRQELVETIADIIQIERQHKVLGTNVQQKINDKCNATGRFLASERGNLIEDEEPEV